ncbi:selenide, water dikinase SelD [Pseudonocardia sp. DSM 110487]|uniref:selenide, water dikinase SelD n=1 Tax=Pseudonocardia sp. DSM 110487 TaxID=2865833 RepID=UPI001C6A0762|nr:selenide, water dikinase SelD [Pseudonocardia sp. DSM 110487]QYN32870.1 selenide, water dikinase SelD [Pseudonocardia sp. DSM 110487]
MTRQADPVRLTRFSHGAGCGCKIGPGRLAEILATVTPTTHPDLLVGTESGDDAAVWRLDADRALVATTDFFTPVVDDPRTWGRIAATNAVSDVYAMGGRPLFALNIVAWPSEVLPAEMLGEVLAGGADVGRECGFAVVGGHSIDDPEPKYGLAVVGEVHPDRILTNTGLRPGDALVLTKPLGIGIATTAVKAGTAPDALLDAAVATMCMPNDAAAAAALAAGAAGCTDVTGFGLLGHLRKMAAASGVDAVVEMGAVPLLPGAREQAEAGFVPGGTRRNREWVAEVLDVAPGIGETDVMLLADAQTSGGLLFGAEPEKAAAAVAELREQGVEAAVIGRVAPGRGRILVQP